MTRDDDVCDRRQYEKDDDSVLNRAPAPPPRAAASPDGDLLHAPSMPPSADNADGDEGHHVESDAEARNVTRWDAAASDA